MKYKKHSSYKNNYKKIKRDAPKEVFYKGQAIFLSIVSIILLRLSYISLIEDSNIGWINIYLIIIFITYTISRVVRNNSREIAITSNGIHLRTKIYIGFILMSLSNATMDQAKDNFKENTQMIIFHAQQNLVKTDDKMEENEKENLSVKIEAINTFLKFTSFPNKVSLYMANTILSPIANWDFLSIKIMYRVVCSRLEDKIKDKYFKTNMVNNYSNDVQNGEISTFKDINDYFKKLMFTNFITKHIVGSWDLFLKFFWIRSTIPNFG